MPIKKDALDLLAEIYNKKVDNKSIKQDELFSTLRFTVSQFENAYDYLEEKGLVTKKAQTMGKSANGLKNRIGVMITSEGIDAIEEEDDFKHNFGSLKIEINQHGHVIVNNQNQGQSVNNISAPVVKDATHKNTGDINYGNIINNQTVSDNSANYDIDKKDVAFIEDLSIKITNKYGEQKPTLVGIISLISGIITIYGGIGAYMDNNSLFPWHPGWLLNLSQNWGIAIIVVGSLLTFLGGTLISVVQYKFDSKCPKCKQFYALKEYGEPTEREVKGKGGVRRTTTRHYKCKHCGHTTTRKFNEFEEDTST